MTNTHPVEQAEHLFLGMLADKDILCPEKNRWGFHVSDNPPSMPVWATFKDFSKLRFELGAMGDDSLLFQWGVSEELEKNSEYFYLNFTRQFSLHDDEGNYVSMEHLSCTLKYSRCTELAIPPGNFWSHKFSNNSFQLFADAVESTPLFGLGMTRYTPFRLEVYQGQV